MLLQHVANMSGTLAAKCCVVVLGNHKDCVWSKSDCFAAVLRGDLLQFLVSLAVEKRRPPLSGGLQK